MGIDRSKPLRPQVDITRGGSQARARVKTNLLSNRPVDITRIRGVIGDDGNTPRNDNILNLVNCEVVGVGISIDVDNITVGITAACQQDVRVSERDRETAGLSS